MDELTKPLKPKAELQILRTRHPPAIYLHQLSTLLGDEGIAEAPLTLSTRLEELPEKDRLFLAVEGDHLIGYAHVRIVYDLLEGSTCEIASVFVEQKRRRQGFGRRLVAAAESWARQAGFTRLALARGAMEVSGQAFFRALGYRPEHQFPLYSRQLN